MSLRIGDVRHTGAGKQVVQSSLNGTARKMRDAAARLFLDDRGELSEPARIFLAEVARHACVISSSFVPGDPYATAFNEGRRDVWLFMDQYISMNEDDHLHWVNETELEGDTNDD